MFLPNLFRRETGRRLLWRTPTNIRSEHRILVWHDLSRLPQQLPLDKVLVDQQGLVWILPSQTGFVAAVAVAFKGLRLGSWLCADLPSSLERARVSPRLFAFIRWLRIPVLNNAYGRVMKGLAEKDYASFVSGWLGVEPLPDQLIHRDAEEGLETIVREFLWSYSERDHYAVKRLVNSLPSNKGGGLTENETLESCLIRLGEDYPSVAYSFARSARGHEKQAAIRSAAGELASQSQGGNYSVGMNGLVRHCGRLLDVDPLAVENAFIAFERRLNGGNPTTNDQSFYLRRLGEMGGGRRSLTAFLFFRLLGKEVV